MKNVEIQLILAEIAEDAAPSAEIDLWKDLRHLATSESRLKQGDASMKIEFSRTVIMRRAALACLVTAIAFAVLLAIPQGRAIAQTLFRFFLPTESESYPIPVEDLNQSAPTPIPTFELSLRAISPPTTSPADRAVPIPTSSSAADILKNCSDAGAKLGYACQVALAESQAGFDARELPSVPREMAFTDAQGDLVGHIITINYMTVQGGTYLIFTQGLGTMPLDMAKKVPVSAIERVKVGKYAGELVQGGFHADNGASEYTWHPDDADLHLVWAQGNRWFSLRKLGNVEVMWYMDKKFLLDLAASLVDNPNPQSNTSLDSNYQMSFREAEAAAGFDLLEPIIIPDGFEFSYAHYDPAARKATLFYHPKGQPAGVGQLVILEILRDQTDNEVFSCQQCPAGTFEKIQVNGENAYYSSGSAGAPNQSLSWSTPSLLMILNYASTEWYGGQVEKESLIKIAESMK